MILLEQRKLRIGFNKSGKGSFTPRLILPMSWIKEMNISPDERDVLVTFEDGKIIIEKLKMNKKGGSNYFQLLPFNLFN